MPHGYYGLLHLPTTPFTCWLDVDMPLGYHTVHVLHPAGSQLHFPLPTTPAFLIPGLCWTGPRTPAVLYLPDYIVTTLPSFTTAQVVLRAYLVVQFYHLRQFIPDLYGLGSPPAMHDTTPTCALPRSRFSVLYRLHLPPVPTSLYCCPVCLFFSGSTLLPAIPLLPYLTVYHRALFACARALLRLRLLHLPGRPFASYLTVLGSPLTLPDCYYLHLQFPFIPLLPSTACLGSAVLPTTAPYPSRAAPPRITFKLRITTVATRSTLLLLVTHADFHMVLLLPPSGYYHVSHHMVRVTCWLADSTTTWIYTCRSSQLVPAFCTSLPVLRVLPVHTVLPRSSCLPSTAHAPPPFYLDGWVYTAVTPHRGWTHTTAPSTTCWTFCATVTPGCPHLPTPPLRSLPQIWFVRPGAVTPHYDFNTHLAAPALPHACHHHHSTTSHCWFGWILPRLRTVMPFGYAGYFTHTYTDSYLPAPYSSPPYTDVPHRSYRAGQVGF